MAALEPMPAFGLGRLPRITFGAGAFEQLPDIVARHGSRALLVTGGRSFAASPRRAALERGLTAAGVTLAGTVSVSGEPGLGDIEVPVHSYRALGIEVVLGIGGGAVLDTAKAIAGLLPTTTSLLDHLEGVGRGVPYPGHALPVVAVPTTAGTGSEATRNAVITERGPQGFKRSFRDESMVPADAVVDPDLLATAPLELIAANGLDALTQLLEAFTSQRATPVTDALACDGLAACRDGLLAWYEDPEGEGASAARSRMAYAALLSGICLANAGLGAVHGLASPLGAQLPIPHGMACGAVLWPTIETNIRALAERRPGSPALAKYARAGRILGAAPGTRPGHVSTGLAGAGEAGAGEDDAAGWPVAGDEAARGLLLATLHDWSQRLRVPSLSTFGMTAAHVPVVVADSPGSSMRTNPIDLGDDELTVILDRTL
jgi:alcohol dehydrogenase class IV